MGNPPLRLLRILAGVLAAVLVVVIGLALVAPDAVARLLVGRAAAWSGIELKGVETLDVSLADARIEGGPLSFGKGAGTPGRIGRFRADLDGWGLVSGRLVFEELALADADLRLTLDADGKPALNGIPLGSASGEGRQPETAAEGRRPGLPAIGIHQSTIERARLEVSRGPARSLPVLLERLRLSDLLPETPDAPARLEVAGRGGEARFAYGGEAKVFGDPIDVVLDGGFEGSVRDLELPELSPYLAALAGLNAESGRFAATGQATAANGKLKGVVDVDIQTLDLVPAAKKGRDPAADLTGVPVELAIALLEDANRRIDLSLPFSGDLSSPKVDYCDVIRTALLGAVRIVVTAPLRGGDKTGTARGPGPVPFDAGSAALTADALRQLDRMAGLLAAKPRLHLQVCGRSTAADARALGGSAGKGAAGSTGNIVATRMLALAQERSRVALERLAASAGVKPDQVRECRPIADAKDLGPAARVEARF